MFLFFWGFFGIDLQQRKSLKNDFKSVRDIKGIRFNL